jgi:hypothetical protein
MFRTCTEPLKIRPVHGHPVARWTVCFYRCRVFGVVLAHNFFRFPLKIISQYITSRGTQAGKQPPAGALSRYKSSLDSAKPFTIRPPIAAEWQLIQIDA